jgi:hypothetical protein
MTWDTADIAGFFDEDMPGYVSATVGGTAMAGLFRKAYADVLGISGNSPALRIVSAAAPSVAHGTAVVVGGVSYTVTAVEPDSLDGTALLRLQES